MSRYTLSEERLQRRFAKNSKEAMDRAEQVEFRKRRELMRRRVHAALYEPRQCLGDPINGEACNLIAVPGATMCAKHGGTTKAMQNAARMRLLYLVEPAMRIIGKLLDSMDENIQLKAAQILLDRAGFHPHATLEIKEQPQDLSNFSTDQLKARTRRLLEALENAPNDAVANEYPDIDTIDAQVVEEDVSACSDTEKDPTRKHDPEDPISVH